MTESDGLNIPIKNPLEIGIQEGVIRKGHTDQGTGAKQQMLSKPVQSYIADGDLFEVDANQERLFPDTGIASIPRGVMIGDWQSRTASFNQTAVDSFLDSQSPTYNPANYERMMAQMRCDAYEEVQAGSHAWDTMTRDERNVMKIDNPQRAQTLEQDFFSRLDEKYGLDAGEAMALEYGYTQDDLYGEGTEDAMDSRTESDFDKDRDWVGESDIDMVPNRAFSPTQALRELEESRQGVEANPHLDVNAEKISLETLDREELKTGVVRPQDMYAGNDGFASTRTDGSLKTGDIVSRFEENGKSGSTGRFTSRATTDENRRLDCPSFYDRSMVEMKGRMQEHFFQVADGFICETDAIIPPDDTDVILAEKLLDWGETGLNHIDNETKVDTPASSGNDAAIDTKKSSPLSADASVNLNAATPTIQNASDAKSEVPITASVSDQYRTSVADRIRQTPSLESNRWASDRGESVCAPQSDAARQVMEQRGIAGIQYQDGIPDFSSFAESTVKLGYMTDARHNQGLTAGRNGRDSTYTHYEDGEPLSESHHANKSSLADLHMKYDKPGNFEQADAITAEQWTADSREDKDWTADDVAQYRKDNGLTWHECNDMETIQLIPEAINADFGHLGGVGEVKETKRIIDGALRDYDEDPMVKSDDYDRMSSAELKTATHEHGRYNEDGVWFPEEENVTDIVREAQGDAGSHSRDGATEVELSQGIKAERSIDVDNNALYDNGESQPADSGNDVQSHDGELQSVDSGDDALPDDGEPQPVDTGDDGLPDDESQLVDMGDDAHLDDSEPQHIDTGDDSQPDYSEPQPVDTGDDAQSILIVTDDENFVDNQNNQNDEGVEEAGRETTKRAAQEEAKQEATEQAAQEETGQQATEQAAREDPEQKGAVQAAQEDVEQESAEQAVQEDAEQEATEQEITEDAAQEDAEQEIIEDATQENAEQEAAEESFDALADEVEAEDNGDTEDYDNLSDKPAEEIGDDSNYDDFSDEAVNDYQVDSEDYADLIDDIDTSSYEDSSIDTSDTSLDSGDTRSFDGGGDSIE